MHLELTIYVVRTIDLEGLPFGGVGISGIDCFSGVEGLRGQCIARACTEDRVPFLRTSIPSPLDYPLKESSAEFQQSYDT